GLDRGRAPVLAMPADADEKRSWRASIWAVDGGAAPIAIAARSLRLPAQPMGKVAFAPLPIEGLGQELQVAAVAVPDAGLARLVSPGAGLSQGSTAGRPLQSTEGGVLVPQSEWLWLLARGSAGRTVEI